MDTIFFNARFYSHASGFSKPEAMLVRNGMIMARGSKTGMEQLAAKPVLVDAGGNYILPGFNDAHIHLWKVGNLQTFLLDVRGVSSLEELGKRLATAAEKLNDPTAWIIARGFNEAIWDRPELPGRNDLDRYVPFNPVHLMRTCAHIVVLNSAAVNACGLSPDTVVPAGGEIRKSRSGNLSGVITESALGLVAAFIPAYTAAQYKTMIHAAEELLFSFGITSVTDPAVHPELLEVYHTLNRNKQLRIRINAIPILLPDGEQDPVILPPLFESPGLKVQTAKLFADGGLSSQTAALKRPYLIKHGGRQNFGVLRIPAVKLRELVFSACEQGYTMATHAIGDLAIEQVLSVYEQAWRQFARGRPNRIEHLELPSARDLDTMHRLGCIAVIQPVFIRELGLNFRQSLDKGYLNSLIPVKTLLDRGIVTAFSTDAPVVSDLNPFQNIATAFTRADLSGHLFSAEEAVSVTQSIAAYTVGSARAEFSAGQKGSLDAGMYADLIFLKQNPLETPVSAIAEIKVCSTWIGGVCVFDREARMRSV